MRLLTLSRRPRSTRPDPRPAAPRRRLRAVATALTTSVAVTGSLLLTTGPVQAAVPVPKPPVPLPAHIEPLAKYQGQTTCSPTTKPGVVAFSKLVLATYPKTGSSGIARACTTGGVSEHKEGRAWDWRVNVAKPTEAAQATAMIKWLLARDAAGNPHAMARRTGVMYIVWNDRIWTASRAKDGWRPYVHSSCRTIPLAKCSPTLRHLDHTSTSPSPGQEPRSRRRSGPVADLPGRRAH